MRAANQLVVTVLALLAVSACPPPPARAADWWESTVVDTGEYMEWCNSLTILPSGQPAISYRTGELKYAWFDGNAWHSTRVDSGGSFSSLAILPSGQPAISYVSGYYLKYAWFDGASWDTTILGTAQFPYFTSLAILPSGQPAISYESAYEARLKYAWFDGQTWQTTVVDNVGVGGSVSLSETSLVVLPTGQPAISYFWGSFPYNFGCLKYAWFDGSTWQKTIVDDPSPGAWSGVSSSMTVLPSGQPAISHAHGSTPAIDEVRYSWFDGSEWHTEIVDSEGNPGWFTSLAILPSGQPAIAYSDGDPYVPGTFKLKYAWFDGTDWHTTTIDDSPGDVGGCGLSLAILPSGQPAVSYDYWDGTRGHLKCASRRAVSGDVNCDGQVNFDDIDPFVLALSGPAAYQAVYPDCHWLLADIDGNGTVDFDDIDPFVALLGG